MHRLAQGVIVHEDHARETLALLHEVREGDGPHGQRDEPVGEGPRAAAPAPGGAPRPAGAPPAPPPPAAPPTPPERTPPPPTGATTVATSGSCSAISSPTVACPDTMSG